MTPPDDDGPIEIPAGTPLADAVGRAIAAFQDGDVAAGDDAYVEALGLVAPQSALWSKLAVDHVGLLLTHQHASLALRRCDEYLRQGNGAHVRLLLKRAEAWSATSHHHKAHADAAVVRDALERGGCRLSPEEMGKLYRVMALAAADAGDEEQYAFYLAAARSAFRAADNRHTPENLAALDGDAAMVAVWRGDETVVDAVLSGPPPQTLSEHLLRARALRHRCQYEDAITVLRAALSLVADPALRLPVLSELTVLYRLSCQDDVVERLHPLLAEAAAHSPDPAQGAAAVARLVHPGPVGELGARRFDRQVEDSRRLVAAGRLDDARLLLAELEPLARTDRDRCLWHLAYGEERYARGVRNDSRAMVEEAALHLRTAVDLASTNALVEARAFTLRLLGHAHYRLGADDLAVGCWTEARELGERIVAAQQTDAVRMKMLLAFADEHDESISAAAEALEDAWKKAPRQTLVSEMARSTAAVVVAMEAARGATILDRILPKEKKSPAYGPGMVRDLPRPGDLDGAYRWARRVTAGLPRGQVVWIMHTTPTRVHHAVLGRRLSLYISAGVHRHALTEAVDLLMGCWGDRYSLSGSVRNGDFDTRLATLAEMLGIGKVVGSLPDRVSRIAIVAGGLLSDIPFAAMTVPAGPTGPGADRSDPLGLRFALSDLPCLSALTPLAHRSAGVRGDRRLLVSPPVGLVHAVPVVRRTVLGARPGRQERRARTGDRRHRYAGEASPQRLSAEAPGYHQVRIDCHGESDPLDARRSWLQLMPAGSAGRLTPDDVERLDLGSCGTVLLGACESGMSQRIGHDERAGFVRSAICAGAASVLAARWKPSDAVGGPLLDRVEYYLRYLPRDVALQYAQRDAAHGRLPVLEPPPKPSHPAWWACWTLYGDTGWQTSAGPLRRLWRRLRPGPSPATTSQETTHVTT